MSEPPVALTIAGSDSGGGAGIVADLKTFEAHGVWGTAAVVAVTAQNTLGVQAFETLPPRLVRRADRERSSTDIGVDAAQDRDAGRRAELVDAVAAAVRELRHRDRSSSTRCSCRSTATRCWPTTPSTPCATSCCRWPRSSRPNLPEAAALVGVEVDDRDGDGGGGARACSAIGRRASSLVKGGHLGGDDVARPAS